MTQSVRHTAIVLHEIMDSGGGAFEDITRSRFAGMLAAPVPIRSLADAMAPDMQTNAVVMTFDDGHLSDHDIALPLLRQADASATFFIVPDFIGKDGFMQWHHVRALHDAGMEIGSHSLTHPDFRRLDSSAASDEFSHSKQEIEQQIGAPIHSFAFPFGFAPKRYYTLARAAGYSHVMGSHHGRFGHAHNQILPRNSIHRGMVEAQISRVLQPDLMLQARWLCEDSTKSALKQILPEKLYHKIRATLARTEPPA